jgi:23S rRNA (cytosine1962-C5)-methyltransferase
VWQWLADRIVAATDDPEAPPGVLNLFGYTGAATLAAAAAGASVVHADASRPAVAWARRNADLSGLAGRPIRWLVDDAETFLRREARRGRRYAGLILDPPSYGHGPSGNAWRLEERLEPLVGLAADVAAPGAFIALSAHTPGIGPQELSAALAWAFGESDSLAAGPLDLEARSGGRLPLGSWARMMAGA